MYTKPILSALLLAALPLAASTITVSTDLGVLTSAQPGAATVTFDLPFTPPAGVNYTWAGSVSPIVSGSLPGEYASPPSDSSSYLTVGSAGGPSSVTIDFTNPISYFGFYMGSPDTYNSVTVYADDKVQTFSGSDFGFSGPIVGDTTVGGFVSFNIAGGTISKIVLSSSESAFETDNHAFVAAPTASPEPGTVILFGAGLGLIGISFRRRKRA